ncbi:MAG: class B sortase [Christensenellaceae bacterium]
MARKLTDSSQPSENDSATKKKLHKNIISIVVIAVAAVVLIFALINIFNIKGEDYENASTYQKIEKAAVTQPDAAQIESADKRIDFAALHAINEEIVGWITIDGTKIDYPLTQAKDNDYYISHNAEKLVNRGGAIFLDKDASADFSDQNTVIYGHNMNDGSMFADLHKYENADFFLQHRFVDLYTPDGKQQYEIFAAYKTADNGQTYTHSFADADAFLTYLDDMSALSTAKSDAVLTANDTILTLSTCVKGEDTFRYVVQAVKMKA